MRTCLHVRVLDQFAQDDSNAHLHAQINVGKRGTIKNVLFAILHELVAEPGFSSNGGTDPWREWPGLAWRFFGKLVCENESISTLSGPRAGGVPWIHKCVYLLSSPDSTGLPIISVKQHKKKKTSRLSMVLNGILNPAVHRALLCCSYLIVLSLKHIGKELKSSVNQHSHLTV